MAALKEIRGTTPDYTIIFSDASNQDVDPSTEFTKIVVHLYNIKSNTIVATFSTDPQEGEESLTVSSEDISFIIPAEKTLAAESGDNRLEVWTTDVDDIIDCSTCVFNEFIDAKDAI
jgi:PKD repeat protein